ncbi:MAG: toprim domain-containing protein [Salinisphaeraceae bacterium]
MDPSLQRDIQHRLTHDLGGVVKGKFVRRIACPDCDAREAYAYADGPWMVFCGRLNNCGSRIHVKDLFPDLFDSWTERFAQPEAEKPDPTAVARAYLTMGRGFDLDALKRGKHYAFSQEYFQHPKLGIGSTTVRFTLPGGAWWERLIDKPYRFGSQKANFQGDYKGDAWQLNDDATFVAAGEVWIVEGIFDAIALAHHNVPAIAAMSCTNFPSQALGRIRQAAIDADQPRPTLVWALDSNRAGRDWTLKHVSQAQAQGWNSAAAQPPDGRDWNDLHQRNELDETDVERYRYYGALLLAESPTRKAVLMYQRRERREFWFIYRSQVWWCKLDPNALNKALKAVTGDDNADERQVLPEEREQALHQAASVTRICTAHPTALYYQANEVTDESWYYWRVEQPGGAQIRNTFSGGQLASASEFKKRLLGVSAGAVWTGSSDQLDTLLQDQLGQIKTVQTIDFVGYSREHRTYVLGDVAVSKGRLYRINKEDYFELGRTRLKSLAQPFELHINPELDQFRRDWVRRLVGAFGANGVVALAYWTGALMAEQIRAEFKSFPFLEIIGEAGSGKTTIIEFLWKLCGAIDREGFDPTKSTAAARARNFAAVANLPVVLIESDREQDGGNRQKQFDWDELKPIFNGRSVRARGVKNSGNETYEPPFRGALVISQNAEVQASEAVMSRITQLRFTRATQTPETRELALALEREPVEDVSGFILQVATAEARLLRLMIDRARSYENYLLDDPGIRNQRIATTHAQLLALCQCLGPEGLRLISKEDLAAASEQVIEMARQRQIATNADHPMVQEFWEAFDYLESFHESSTLNHMGDWGTNKGRIAINLKDFEAQVAHHRLTLPPTRELKPFLKGSRSRKFIESNRAVHSRIRDGATVKCWIFEAPGGPRHG